MRMTPPAVIRESAKTGPLAAIGLHPAAAVGVAAVDSMLFGATTATLGAGWLVSIPAGIALGIAVGLIQRRGSMQDDRGLAAGKGILVAVLTAIPTALPSYLSMPLVGTAGAVTLVRNRRRAIAERSGDGDPSD